MNATVEFIDVWAVLLGGDDRSPGNPAEWYSTLNKAVVAAKGRGWYGGDASTRKYSAVQINDKVFVLQYNDPVDLDGKLKEHEERVRQGALAKLTDEEKQALLGKGN